MYRLKYDYSKAQANFILDHLGALFLTNDHNRASREEAVVEIATALPVSGQVLVSNELKKAIQALQMSRNEGLVSNRRLFSIDLDLLNALKGYAPFEDFIAPDREGILH